MRPEMIEEAALLRRHWHVEQPSSDLAARIVAHATKLPQHTPWKIRFHQFLHTLFGGWNLALIPATAAAALLILGAFDSQVPSLDDDPAVEALIMESMVGSEEM